MPREEIRFLRRHLGSSLDGQVSHSLNVAGSKANGN